MEAVRKICAAWERGDGLGALKYMSPDIAVCVTHIPEPAEGSGHRAMRRAMATWVRAFESFEFVVDEYWDGGDQVVVLSRQQGRLPGREQLVEGRFVHVWTVTDGKAVRFEDFATKEEALEAVGLREPNESGQM